MISPGNDLGPLLSRYEEQWLSHIAQFEHRLQLLQTLKQGMELLVLVCSFLFYYLIDCIAQIMAMPFFR
jgi:hypothetical protein